jgi:Glycosyl hydrolase family 20, catalytic domain
VRYDAKTKEEILESHDPGNTGKKSRRDFLASGIAGIAGSTLLAEQIAIGAPIANGASSGILKQNSLSPEASWQGNPGEPKKGAGQLRGLMADAGRVPEDPSYYRRAIDFCHEWNMNAYLISLADDQGCAFRFKSHPELITHKNALTYEQAKELGEYARQRGVELIPEIESFGHTHFITAVPQYAHLQDAMQGGRNNFSAVCPVAPETLKLFTNLYREVAEVFPSRYFHGGCDEVNWGGSDLSREALKKKTRDEIWAEYVNSLDEVVRGLGKDLIVWGDFVLHKQPGVLPRLNKDIIVMDWQYYVTDPKPLEQAARKVVDAGLRAIGAPAIISCRWGPRAGANALRNIDAFADAYSRIDSPRALGVIVTNWVPSRYIQRSLWDTYAYTAVALNEGSSAARASAFRRFVEKHYQSEWNENWSDIFTTLYEITPNQRSCSPAWMQPVLPVPWSSDDDLKSAVQSAMVNAPPFRRLLSQLVFSEAQVRDNLDDFLTFRLSVEYLEHVFWRITVLTQEAAKSQRTPESAAALIRIIAQRDQRLLEKLDASWNKGRASDAAARTETVFDLGPRNQLLFAFHQAATYSQQLAQDPERFARLLGASS